MTLAHVYDARAPVAYGAQIRLNGGTPFDGDAVPIDPAVMPGANRASHLVAAALVRRRRDSATRCVGTPPPPTRDV